MQVDIGMIFITYCNCYVTLFGMVVALIIAMKQQLNNIGGNEMATLAFGGDKLSIGRDFVDAVTGKPQSKGEIKSNHGPLRQWTSTFNITDTEHILRTSVRSEGARVTFFRSQAV